MTLPSSQCMECVQCNSYSEHCKRAYVKESRGLCCLCCMRLSPGFLLKTLAVRILHVSLLPLTVFYGLGLLKGAPVHGHDAC